MARLITFKRLGALTLAILMCLIALVGCDGQTGNGGSTTGTPTTSTPTTETPTTETPTTDTPTTDTPTTDTPTTDAPATNSTTENLYDFGEPDPGDVDLREGSYTVATAIAANAKSTTKRDGYTYILATSKYMEIGGIEHPAQNNNKWYRLDYSKKDTYSDQNETLAACMSGVTVRFKTNADKIYLKVTMWPSGSGGYLNTSMKHFTDRGAFGCDVYLGTGTDRIFCGSQSELLTNSNGFDALITLPGGYQEVTINLPLYAGVSNVEIGIPNSSKIALPTERTYGTICFYGSSITQGGCVSRPGNSYSNIICRRLNADNMNLGFSGSAKGEQSVAKYIAYRDDVAALVMDYDHNNTVDGLKNTHYAFYETVRKAHPDIPIIMVTRPVFLKECTTEQLQRQAVIKESYEKAVAAGDDNVYYVSGNDFFPKEMPDLYTVDTTHPNDLGHYLMAKTIFSVLKPALEKAYD